MVLLTKNLALDYGRRGIRANCICPGFIDTPLFRSVFADEHMAPYRERIREQHELGRGSVLIVQPGTALQLSNRHDDELRLFVYGAPPERGEATFLPTID